MAGPPPVFSGACLPLPGVFLSYVCLPKRLLLLPVLPNPQSPSPSPQFCSQGSHFVHPLVSDPGNFVMPGLSDRQHHRHRAERCRWPEDHKQGVRGLRSQISQGEKAELSHFQGDLPAQLPPETQQPTFQP